MVVVYKAPLTRCFIQIFPKSIPPPPLKFQNRKHIYYLQFQDIEDIGFWKFWLEGVALPIVGGFGVTGEVEGLTLSVTVKTRNRSVDINFSIIRLN